MWVTLARRGKDSRTCGDPCAHGIRASLHIIACIEDPVVIRKILTHLQEKSPMDSEVRMPNARAPR